MTVSGNLAGNFLAEYAALLLCSGATCARIEKNVGRMAATWGLQSGITILPHHVTLSIRADKEHGGTFVGETGPASISFNKITRLSQLSWEVADHKLDLDETERKYRCICKTSPADRWWVLFAVSCANAAFCRLFSGDMVATAIVALSTLCGYYLKQELLARKIDVRLVFMLCAFISSVLACADFLFSLGQTPQIAVGTSVLYLVPGIPFLNSFSDMLDHHYICFFGRLMDAIVLTASLSIGLCAGMWLMQIGMF